MDEVCDELSDIQQLEEDLSEFPNDDEDDEEENNEEDEDEIDENAEDDDDDDDSNIFTSMSLNDEQAEEKPNVGNGLDIAVKLEVSILEDEENQNSSQGQQVKKSIHRLYE